MKLLTVTIFLLTTSVAFGQVNWTEGWEESTLKKARVSESSKMNQVEKDVVFYTNLVRLDPKRFLETIVPKYIESRNVENSSYLSSLKRDLRKTKKLSALELRDDLYEVAKGHAISSGKKGTIGHQNYSRRYKAVEATYIANAENCDYGSNEAIDIVFSWLIDEGVSNLGHRKNLLDPEFNCAGVAVAPHKKYEVNAVMSLGTRER